MCVEIVGRHPFDDCDFGLKDERFGKILRQTVEPRGDSFPDVVSAIRAYSGKSLPAFFAVPKIYFPLILLALVNIWDNLSRICRDKGGVSAPLTFGLNLGTIPVLSLWGCCALKEGNLRVSYET